MKICLLVQPQRPTETATLLGDTLRAAGHAATPVDVTALALRDGEIVAEGSALAAFDVVWITSVGARGHFYDTWQMLSLLAAQTRVINHPDALAHLHSKYALAWLRDIAAMPPTLATNNAEALWAEYRKGGDWILKPPADAQGRGVLLLKEGDVNARSLFEHVTQGGNYALLQLYLPEIKTNGEKRVLLAGGEIIGHYLRKPTLDHRTNLHQGAQAEACDLTTEERTLCTKLAGRLAQRGASFAGIDLIYPHVLEVNVINPGGIGTIQRLTGKNIAPEIVARTLAN